MLLSLLLIVPASVAPATNWMGTEFGEARDCPVARFVMPGGPAWSAGLREGACVLQANGKKVRSLTQLLEAVAESESAGEVSLRTEDGSTAVVRKSKDSEFGVRYCRWLSGQRVRVVVHRKNGDTGSSSEWEFARPPSLADVRRRAGVTGAARVVLQPDCGGIQPQVYEWPSEQLTIRRDATVFFTPKAAPVIGWFVSGDGGVSPVVLDGGF